MKIRTYMITKKAVSDLEEIWLYTVEKWSAEQADRYYNLIFDEINDPAKTAMPVSQWNMHGKDTERQK